MGTTAAAAVIVALAATHPAALAQSYGALVTAVTCATSGACVAGTNTSSGPGVTGSNTNSGPGVTGASAKGTGIVAKGATGLSATGTSGVTAAASTGIGISGQSASGIGVLGATNSPYSAGVEGFTSNTAASAIGVYGYAKSGLAMYGQSSSGPGGTFTSYSGVGLVASSQSSTSPAAIIVGQGAGATLSTSVIGTGVDAESASGTGLIAHSQSGAAIRATTDSGVVAIYGNAPNGNGTEITGGNIGIVGRSNNTPLYLSDGFGDLVFYVNGQGNVYYHGTLNSFVLSGGRTILAYGTSVTQPSVEDTGTARLVDGSATVRLDPAFALAIEPTGYRVFVTPGGETRGLYVVAKTPSDFVVRESSGGRSNVTFDYRIVAVARGQAGHRIASTKSPVPDGAPVAKMSVAPPLRSFVMPPNMVPPMRGTTP